MVEPAAGPETQTSADYETALQADDRVELRVWLRLLTCTNLMERRVRSRLRTEFETTLPRFDVLAQLDRAPQGLTMGALSSRLMVSAGNLTGLTERLENEGLVTRAASPNDRRTQLVRLTPKGKRAFDAMTPSHAAWVTEMMAGLGGVDKTALLALLGKLKDSLTTADNKEGKA
jgi:DNA-binding MarR family transcriptional regulator